MTEVNIEVANGLTITGIKNRSKSCSVYVIEDGEKKEFRSNKMTVTELEKNIFNIRKIVGGIKEVIYSGGHPKEMENEIRRLSTPENVMYELNLALGLMRDEKEHKVMKEWRKRRFAAGLQMY